MRSTRVPPSLLFPALPCSSPLMATAVHLAWRPKRQRAGLGRSEGGGQLPCCGVVLGDEPLCAAQAPPCGHPQVASWRPFCRPNPFPPSPSRSRVMPRAAGGPTSPLIPCWARVKGPLNRSGRRLARQPQHRTAHPRCCCLWRRPPHQCSSSRRQSEPGRLPATTAGSRRSRGPFSVPRSRGARPRQARHAASLVCVCVCVRVCVCPVASTDVAWLCSLAGRCRSHR